LGVALALPACAAELKVDHVTIAGRDLKALREKFAAAGIPTEYGGKHTNGMTEMALASFPDGSYLELIAAQNPLAGAPAHYWGKFIDGDAGPCAWAIAVKDIDAEAKRLGGKVNASGRKRLDGVNLKWKTDGIGPAPQGSFFPFLIQDETSRELRVFSQGKPTLPAYPGVAAVYIAVRNLDEAIERYRSAFNLAAPERTIDKTLGAKLATFAGTPVVLAAATGPWLQQRLDKFGEAPFAFILGSGRQGHISWLPLQNMRIGVRK
jgi:hypothetical protein